MKITELVAYVRANVSGFEQGMMRGAQAVDGLDKRFSQFARDVDVMATRVGAAVTGLGTVAAVTFGKFELTMKRAGAVTNTLGTSDFTRLEAAAREMGRVTVFSATQAAEAIELMGLAGLNVNEIIEALPGALQLASSAQITIAKAADIAAKTMRAFGADAKELTRINDVLVATFTRSNTDITMLGESLKHVAPVSHALGVSLEDTAAAIAKMGDAGFQGSIAGTALRNILSRMAGAMPELIEKFNAFGIETTDAAGNMLPFLDILRQIEQAGLTDAQVLELFGARGGPQMLALLEVGSDAIADFSQKLSEAGGIAQRISDANIDSLWGALKLIESAFEDVAIEIGQGMTPQLRGAASSLISLTEESAPALKSLAIDGFRAVLDGAIALIEYLRNSGPEILETARSFWELLRPLGEFAAEHPQLVAGLVALKVTGLLGVNAAAVSLVQTLGSLLTAMMRLGGATVGLGANLATLKTVGLVGALAGFALLMKAAFDAHSSVQRFNAELERTKQLSDEMGKIRANRHQAVLDQAAAMDPADRKRFLQDQLQWAQNEEAGAAASARGAQSALDQANESLVNKAVDAVYGSAAIRVAELEVQEAQGRLAEARQFRQDIEQELKTATQEAVETAKAAGSAAAQMAADTAADLSDAADTNPETGLTAEETKRQSELAPEWERANLELTNLAETGQITWMQMDQFTTSLSQLQAAFIGGQITEEQYRFQVQELDTAIRDAVSAREAEREAIAESNSELANTRAGIVQMLGPLGSFVGVLDKADLQVQQLQYELQTGTLSLDEFEKQVKQLADETKRAADEERRLRIIKGDFAGAGLSVRDALLERLEQAQLQRFNQYVDGLASQLFGLGSAVQPVTERFGSLDRQMQQFGQTMRQIDPGQAAQQLGGFFNYLNNTVQGQIDLVRNNIAQLEQNLTLVDTFPAQQRIQQQLDQLYADLDVLLAQQAAPPVLTPSVDPYADPGLQRGTGSMTFNLELPNVSRVTQYEAQAIADAVLDELSRRGTPVYG